MAVNDIERKSQLSQFPPVIKIVVKSYICTCIFYRDDYHEQMRRALSWLSQDGHLIDIRDNIEDIPFRQKLSESLNPFCKELNESVVQSISIETQ